MLTRSQVARRLGKSIATVRRLENRALHPIRGERDVRLFEDWEVDRLKQDPEKLSRHAQSAWFQSNRTSRHSSRPKSPPRTPIEKQRIRLVAEGLEAFVRSLVDVPTSHLLRAGIDQSAIEVLAAAIEILHKRD